MFEDCFSPMFEDLFQPMFGLSKICQAIRFDGADDYGQLATRAIDPDGDNEFEFWTPTSLAATQNIVSQNNSNTGSQREFHLFVNAGNLVVNFGGVETTIVTTAQGLLPNSSYTLSIIGNTASVTGSNGQLLATTSIVRGAAREPSAPTRIGVRGAAGTAAGVALYFQGLIPYIRINGTYYPLADAGQAIQLPTPSGLGDELITQQVLENPAVQGSQWTYLGAGRWQYVGDGTFNSISFITNNSQPQSGFLEFEVESIDGVMRCYSTTASVGTLQSSPVFSSTGSFRHFFIGRDAIGTGSIFQFQRHLSGQPASCIIKNISFKPLGTSNPMTLFNTVPEQWEQIACDLRPSEDELLTPTITSEPQDQSVLVGETASFTVAAEVELGAVEFQWQADSGAGFVDIPTETSATLSLPLVALIDNGKLVRARVSANGRSAVSRAALLTVGEPI